MPRSIDSTDAQDQATEIAGPVFLIGYRGCGKTTVGNLLAAHLGWKLIDTDALIEASSGKSIADIFEEYGEEEFRRRETESIERAVASKPKTVISLGGGAPTREANRALMSRRGTTIWLRGSPDTLWKRIAGDEKSATQRPNLTSFGGKQEVEEVLTVRNPIYERCADKVIDVDCESPESIIELIIGGKGKKI